ncbi:hypothetical protein P8452_55185 [Trifolium repens]|nr:hypothetical protein P8452_55185 [Trifolium repens]
MVLRCDYIENYSKNLKKQAEALIELPYDQDHAILLDVEAPLSTSMAFSIIVSKASSSNSGLSCFNKHLTSPFFQMKLNLV